MEDVSREEWLAIRRTGLGGSDVVALVGESNYNGPIDVWLDKVEGRPDDGAGERARWGQILEPVVAAEYAARHGIRLESVPTLRHPDRRWHTGSPDRLGYELDRAAPAPALPLLLAVDDAPCRIPRPDEALEIKTHGWGAGREYGAEDTDAVPDDKRIQCAWYMALLDFDEWRLAALIDTHKYREFIIPRDRELEATLLEEAERFWRRHVEAKVPPPPDSSESFKSYVRYRFRVHGAELAVADGAVADLVRKYAWADRQAKEAARYKEKLQREVELAIGANAGLAGPDGKPLVTWKRDSVGRVKDSALIAELATRAGLTDPELTELKDSFRGEPPRRFLCKIKPGDL